MDAGIKKLYAHFRALELTLDFDLLRALRLDIKLGKLL